MTETVHPRFDEIIYEKLRSLYGEEQAASTFQQLLKILKSVPASTPPTQLALSEQDILVIAYGDHLRREGEPPLETLWQILNQLTLPVSGLHILPFYPSSSDDGFSVVDYFQVDPALGTWQDVQALCRDYRVMFDAVFNHISAQSNWFQAFLRGESRYADYFTVVDPSADLSLVTLPRTLPLLTPFKAENGDLHVWTTFSEDQVDLNYANPAVLLDMVRVLLFYVEQGAQLIRLDAIAFLWKQIGTTCIHLPETHQVIQLMRAVLDIIAPQIILVTETNVPHQENISYFGDGENEAQMVYQFPLPPLILHTLGTGDATRLTEWTSGIERISERTTFFNFTASHDGIGLRPVSGILSDAEMEGLVERTKQHGGFVSYKNNPDGTQSPYELNITYFDAITDPAITEQTPDVAAARFIVSQAMMLAFVGVPGIYLPSLFGSRNDYRGAEATGRFRSINREKFDADTLLTKLADPTSLSANVFQRYCALLETRRTEPAFHPLGTQTVLKFDPRVFALMRLSPDGASRVIAVHNVSDEDVQLTLTVSGRAINLLDNQQNDAISTLNLAPYQFLWLKLI